MKKLVVLLIMINLYASDTKEILFLLKDLQKIQYNYKPINKLFNNTKKPKKEIYKLKDTKPKKTQTKYVLEVIFNNKVKINGKWYKNGDAIDNYKILVVDNNVFLINKHKTISLNPKPKVLQ